MFGGGNDVAPRRVHHHNTAPCGGRDVDIIETDAGPAHHLEPCCRLQQIFGHPGSASYHERVVAGNNAFERFRGKTGVNVNRKVGLFSEQLNADRFEIIRNQNFHIKPIRF